MLQDGAKPLEHIEELHVLLTETPLRRLPLWALGSNDREQEIVQTRDDGTGLAQYLVGLRTLSVRNYLVAASYFSEAERLGLQLPTIRPLLVYVLCAGGKLDVATRLAQDVIAAEPNEIHFWRWIGSKFKIGPFASTGSAPTIP